MVGFLSSTVAIAVHPQKPTEKIHQVLYLYRQSSSDSLSMIGGPSRTRIGKGLAKKTGRKVEIVNW